MGEVDSKLSEAAKCRGSTSLLPPSSSSEESLLDDESLSLLLSAGFGRKIFIFGPFCAAFLLRYGEKLFGTVGAMPVTILGSDRAGGKRGCKAEEDEQRLLLPPPFCSKFATLLEAVRRGIADAATAPEALFTVGCATVADP